ncbi:codanin-1 [Anguilla anguilla]|uniref:codanin-1 n=1 Tax=Anguilla anguilla TaxID=7936 RepID=UPI0015A8E3F4|nr:codanin-1 [Anguilla anguilla]
MAALLETVLLGKVETSKAVQWLRCGQEDDNSETLVKLQVPRQDFVPFFLNFLREQSSHALANGPATPAKTPSSRPSHAPGFSSERRGCKVGGGAGHRSASRVQLFSPAPSVSPATSGAEWDPPSGSGSRSQCLSGISALSSPSFSAGWSPASRAPPPERRSAQRACLGDFVTSPPEAGSPSPAPQRRGRRRSGGAGPPPGRQAGGGGGSGGGGGRGQYEDVGRWEVGRRGGGAGPGSRADAVLSPPPAQLNFNNMEDFPPVGTSPASPKPAKPSRRINPTPVSAERPLSKPKSCFTSTPFCERSSPTTIPEGNGALPAPAFSGSLEEERELLRREKSKLAQQSLSPLPVATEPRTPTKPGVRAGPRQAGDAQACCPDPSRVTCASTLDLLAQLYCACISENLVPSVFLELFFVLQLLTSRATSVSEEEDEEEHKGPKEGGTVDVLERRYFRNLHNCVYFAVRVLENQFELVSHLDRCTLRLLAENERVGCFSPSLRDRLAQAQGSSSAKASPSMPPFIQSVPFQPATDNRSNFSSDRAFHTFKKQRDIFYELLREWEDCHRGQGWDYERALGSRVRGMVCQLTAAGNHAHFARLFQKQLVQMCKGPQVLGSPGDAPDPDLLGMLGADSLGRLKRLQERLIQPQGLLGPCPPPSFPGYQEFFRDFLQSASSCQLNQHLTDSLCQQLLRLDEEDNLGLDGAQREGEGDMEQQDEKQRFSSVLLTARLLAKFLGFISFLPYRTPEPPTREIQEASLSLRSKTSPVLDVCAVLRRCVRRQRTVLTVPWVVEFLSMLDFSGPFLLCYRRALCLLLHLYRRMVLIRDGDRDRDGCYLNQLLILAVLGWLFQIPVFPEDLFFSSDLEGTEVLEKPAVAQGLDSLPLVDQQLLYTCCPFLNEFRKLLAAFVAGSTSKSGGLIRKITPTSAEPRGPPSTRSQQKLQVELEQAFFHNQPPSLRRTVEFVAERVASNCVKHIKATLVSELVCSGERTLLERLGSEDASTLKLNDSLCAQLCDRGRQALERGTRFCSEKGPEAIRVLLPEETSPAVLTTSEEITVRLATEKASDWLSTNITALIKREWKAVFERVMKTLPAAPPSTPGEGEGVTAGATKPQPPPPPQGEDASALCPKDCTHSAPLPSDVIIEIKEVLSITVGPRCEGEQQSVQSLEDLVLRLGQTLSCRKFLSPMSEQMLVRCSVLLACSLVSGELPLTPPVEGAAADDSRTGRGCPTRALLEQLVQLWGREPCPPAPLHLLFSHTSLAAVLSASATLWQNFLFLVRQLLQKGLLREEDVLAHRSSLSKLTWPTDSMERIQELSSVLSQPLPSPAHRDTLQSSE